MPRLRAFACAFLLAAVAAAAFAADGLDFGPPVLSTGNFSRPYGLAVDEAHGRLLVADTGNQQFKWTDVTTVTGTCVYAGQGYVSDRGAPEALNDPEALAADAAGNVYVVNTLQGNVKFYPWSAGGYGTAQTFCAASSHTVSGKDILLPRDIAVGPDGAVYLLDSGNKRILKADGPAATSWSVFREDPSWSNPYGLTVDAAGAVYVADTGNHRVVKISSGAVTVIGSWGTGTGQFRFPRDVAVDGHGRIYVADTFNHRLSIWSAAGQPLVALGHAPSIGTLEKVAVDSQDRLFAVDSDNNRVIAYLGGDVTPPFDPFIRDYVGDTGVEPSSGSYLISSPDILVRHRPDVNLSSAASLGLESFVFQPPQYGETNYVYLALHNRGTQPAAETFVKLYFYDPSSSGRFPADWKDAGFYSGYSDDAHNTPGNALAAGVIPAGGTVVVGPLLWRPPAPESAAAGDGKFRLGVRVSNPYDYPPSGNSTTMARDSNDVTERPVTVVRSPFPSGNQNTLMVRVHYSDIAAVTDEAVVRARGAEMAAWIKEVSLGQAEVTLLYRGPVTPTKPSTYYADPQNHPLVEMAQDVLDKLTVAEPSILDGSGPGREIDRVVLVTNVLTSTADWATTGTWPYTVGGKTRYLSVSIQGGANPTPSFSHGMSHQLGLVDLYAYDNATFPFPYADGWDNMAKPFNGAHPLVWSKELAYWVTSRGARILFVPRPAPGTTWNNGGQPVALNFQETASTGQVVGVAFGLTNGVTSFNDETAFYYVEARQRAGADAVLPQTGVLMYYANILIPQGQGPVIIRDHAPGGTLADAMIPPGESEAPGGTGLRVTVQNGTNGADYNLAVQYSPPQTDYDVFMAPGNSPDIWVDSQKNGYETTPHDTGEEAIAGEENRVYALVHNAGPAEANDVEAAFFFSEPYHTLDTGEGDFSEFKSVFIDTVPANTAVPAFITWTPQTGVNAHVCTRVELRRLFSDTNHANDQAQRNLTIDHSVHGSPYTTVDFPFQVANATDSARTFYFRAEGIPADWKWSFDRPKAYLLPGELSTGRLMMRPSSKTPDCSVEKVQVTAWTPKGDTLVRWGQTEVDVDLQQKTQLIVDYGMTACPNNQKAPIDRGGVDWKPCVSLAAEGCTKPPRRNEPITLRYVGPDGKPVYHTVTTDANGCFQDFNLVTEGGAWDVTAQFDGSSCEGPATSTGTLKPPLTETGTGEGDGPDGERRLAVTGFSKDARGEVLSAQAENAKCPGCEMSAEDEALHLDLAPNGNFDGAGYSLDIADLRVITRMDNDLQQGLLRGRFEMTGKDGNVVDGRVGGLAQIGTHHPPVTSSSKEGAVVRRHWELFFEGTVVRGSRKGQRWRSAAALDSAPPKVTNGNVGLFGAFEGAWERDCLMTPAQMRRRILRAESEAKAPPIGPYKGTLPCLVRFSRQGKGTLRLDQTGKSRCRPDDKDALCRAGSCGSYKTWSRLDVAAGKDSLVVESLLQVMEGEGGRGVHGGTFEYRGSRGLLIQGQMLGVTRSGSHRAPLTEASETFDPPNHLEGRLVGQVMNGPDRGATVAAGYVLQTLRSALVVKKRKSFRLSSVAMTVEGWEFVGPLEAPVGQEPKKAEAAVTKPEVPAAGRTLLKTPAGLPAVLVRERAELPEAFYRPLSAIPTDAVAAMTKVEGGRLSKTGERQLRLFDRKFRDLDANGDGVLSPAEFAVLYQPKDEKERARSLEHIRTSLDENKDGRLTKEDAKLWASLAYLDADHDGQVSLKELAALPVKSAERDFARVDANHDGKVDFTEFALWQRTLPQVSIAK